MSRTGPLCGVLFAHFVATVGVQAKASDSLIEHLEQGRLALRQGQFDEALEHADRAVQAAPEDPRAYGLRGAVHSARSDHEKAIADFDHVLELDPKAAEMYDRRGSEHFKLGHIRDSIRDFERFIELRPDAERGHWRRGISYYYAGRYEEGRRQFESYQTVDANDVENVVWRFLCMARQDGVVRARRELLPVGLDRRVPMMEVYELFRGSATPDDVLAAARAGKPTADQLNQRLFYAHLYTGLYYEALGEEKQAARHITKAAEEHQIIGHYMWHVARVHAARLEEREKRTPETAPNTK